MKKLNVKRKGIFKAILNKIIYITKNETFKNKIMAIVLIILGVLSIILLNDITVFILILFIAIPLLIAKRNWID